MKCLVCHGICKEVGELIINEHHFIKWKCLKCDAIIPVEKKVKE